MVSTAELTNRIIKRKKILQKWAIRNQTQAYRLYDKDIPDYPIIIDIYADKAAIWFYPRKKDDNQEATELFQNQALLQIKAGLKFSENNIFLKKQCRQKGYTQNNLSEKNFSQRFVVKEQGLKFEVDLINYLDTGLFLDHRNSRKLIQNKASNKRVLNLFAYTGSFSCYALAGGASSVCTIDLSKTYCQWAERNLNLNGFKLAKNNLIINEDVFYFLKNQSQKFDLIICDPPSFSVSKNKNATSFSIQNDYPHLLKLALSALAPKGEIFFSTNQRNFVFDPTIFKELQAINLTNKTIPFDFQNKKIHQTWLLENLV